MRVHLNNPLSATDPSGYLTFRQVVGIAIAAVAAFYGQYYFAKDMLALSFAIAVAGGFTASCRQNQALALGPISTHPMQRP